jgi:hypothetical protein
MVQFSVLLLQNWAASAHGGRETPPATGDQPGHIDGHPKSPPTNPIDTVHQPQSARAAHADFVGPRTPQYVSMVSDLCSAIELRSNYDSVPFL